MFLLLFCVSILVIYHIHHSGITCEYPFDLLSYTSQRYHMNIHLTYHMYQSGITCEYPFDLSVTDSSLAKLLNIFSGIYMFGYSPYSHDTTHMIGQNGYSHVIPL